MQLLTLIYLFYRYYDQLVAIQKKVPFKEDTGVHVLFVWKDSIQKGKLFRDPPKLSMFQHLVKYIHFLVEVICTYVFLVKL